MRRFVCLLAVALAACATPLTPINEPLTAPLAQPPARAAQGEDLIILSLSGGGARAASFSLGVLQAMRDASGRDGRPLTEHIALMTSVSGGSVLAAYYALHGEPGLDSFRAAYLDKDWRILRQDTPRGFVSMFGGGINGPARLAEWLDSEVYRGAPMSALGAGPRVVINATDLYNATAFAFTPFFFAGICSDLDSVRVADAVAASMAAPVLFRPVLAESYPGSCADTPQWVARVREDRQAPEIARAAARAFDNYRDRADDRQRYLHLSDGGVADNFGLLSLMVMHAAGPAPAPLEPREAVQARRILVLVVNAEYIRSEREFQRRPDNLSAVEMLYSPLDVATDAAKRAALDAYRAQLPDFEQDLRQFRCALTLEQARELGAPAGWRCDDVQVSLDMISFRDLADERFRGLLYIQTDVSLPSNDVDTLIAGGRAAIEANAALQAFRGD